MRIRSTLILFVTSLALLGTGGPAKAAWPGGDGVVVFAAKQSIGQDGQIGVGLQVMTPGQPGTLRQLTTDGSDLAPQISPDGKSIVFERQIESPPKGSARSAIFLVDLSGQGLRQLTQPGSAESDSDPTFDATGTRVLFARQKPNDGGDLYSIGLAGDSLQQMTQGPGVDSNPADSPTGRQIAFVRRSYRASDNSTRQRIFSMRPDGSGMRNLTAGLHIADLGEPDFAPDGRRILFAAGSGLYGEIFVMRANGSRPRSITACYEHREGFVEPAFSPSGSSFLAAAVDQYGSRLVRFRLGKRCPQSSSLAGDDGASPAWGPAPR